MQTHAAQTNKRTQNVHIDRLPYTNGHIITFPYLINFHQITCWSS